MSHKCVEGTQEALWDTYVPRVKENAFPAKPLSAILPPVEQHKFAEYVFNDPGGHAFYAECLGTVLHITVKGVSCWKKTVMVVRCTYQDSLLLFYPVYRLINRADGIFALQSAIFLSNCLI